VLVCKGSKAGIGRLHGIIVLVLLLTKNKMCQPVSQRQPTANQKLLRKQQRAAVVGGSVPPSHDILRAKGYL
jgi:hypothetical protein